MQDEEMAISIPEALRMLEEEKGQNTPPEIRQRLIEESDICPDIYVYASLFLGLSTQTNIELDREMNFNIKITNGEAGYGIGRGFWEDIQKVWDDIRAVKNISGMYDECATENLCREIYNEIAPETPIEIDESIFALGLTGYLFVQRIKVYASALGDKNLAQICKKAIVKLDEKGELNVISRTSLHFGKKGHQKFHQEFLKLFRLNSYVYGHASYFIQDIVLRVLPKLTSLSETDKENIKSEYSQKSELTTILQDIGVDGIPRGVIAEIESTSASTIFNKEKANLKEDILELFGLNNFCYALLELAYLQGELDLVDLEQSISCIQTMREENYDAYEDFSHSDLYADIEPIWNNGFIIKNLPLYLETLGFYSDKVLEFRTTDIDSLLGNTIEEYCENVTTGIVDNGFRIGEDTISLDPKDIIRGELSPTIISQEYIKSFEYQPEVSKIIVVEYKQPRTLTDISNNTPGNLCVGLSHMPYIKKMEKGQQRHFGVLAQTQDGLHVMYHTHSNDGKLLDSYTDATNQKLREPIEHQKLVKQSSQMMVNALRFQREIPLRKR